MDFSFIEIRLQQEEQAGPPMNRTELIQRHAARTALADELSTLHKAVNTLSSQYHHLLKLPVLEHMGWADAVLHFPNLTFFVIDSTSIHQESDVIRATVIDAHGTPLFDHIIRPQRQPGQSNTMYTGIAREQVLAAPALADIWEPLRTTLSGRYVLAYNWEFLVERLRENASYYHLPPLYFVGECLMMRASNYYGLSSAFRLVDLCRRIGHPLFPNATAPERAAGQIALLHAMAQGITDVQTVGSPPETQETTASDDLDNEHPF